MSAIDQIDLSQVEAIKELLPDGPSPDSVDLSTIEAEIKVYLGTFFWSWYKSHLNDKIFAKKILFITFNIHVVDLTPLFILLFGPMTS